jgi:hypothetical protein
MHRIRALLAAVTVALAACGGDSAGIDGTTGPNAPVPPTPVGTYLLKTVDGKPLPATLGKPIVEDNYTITARALNGQFTFNPDSTFAFKANTEIVTTGKVLTIPKVIENKGTYRFDATTITLTSTLGVTTTMTRAGTTLTTTVSAPAADGGKEMVTMVFSR